MDFDLEIISEEGHSPDPLFSSIINAMSSMKEATADKIYQKIQRQGATNYSKPQLALQVDRALASALRYGIFEVKNHRYRIRDDVLDDIDTIYWKMQKKREQTPFRIPDETNEKHLGQKLDPEKDNLRFKKISDPESEECPQCGRTKRPLHDQKNEKSLKREKKDKLTKKNKGSSRTQKKKQLKSQKYEEKIQEEDDDENEDEEEEEMEAIENFRKNQGKRKFRSSSPTDEKCFKMKKVPETSLLHMSDQNHFGDEGFMRPKKEYMPGGGKYDTTDESELDSMSFLSDDEQSFGSCQMKPKSKQRKNKPICRFDSECDDVGFNRKGNNDVKNRKKSNNSLKSDSATDLSSVTSNDKNAVTNNLVESTGYIFSNQRSNHKNRFFNSNKMSIKEDNPNIGGRKSEWLSDFVEDPTGDVIQRNNMLTIEPRNPMALEGPEHTSYIS